MTIILQQATAQLLSFAIVALIAWALARLYVWRQTQGGLPSYIPPAEGWVAHAVPTPTSDSPRTFSGVAHEARYQAPEVLTEMLERERDARWVRFVRYGDKTGGLNHFNGDPSVEASVRDNLVRALSAKSLDELRATDMRAHGAACVRCGRLAGEHPEFPLCTRTTSVDGRVFPPEPPRPTRQSPAEGPWTYGCGSPKCDITPKMSDPKKDSA